MDLATLPLDEQGIKELRDISDTQLVAMTSEALAVPRTENNSFTLHAPLELATRAALLPKVSEAQRPMARLRIASLGKGFLHSGEPIPPAKPVNFNGPTEALAALKDAVDNADPERADSATSWLTAHVSAGEIASAAQGDLLWEFGAATHAPILFASYLREPDLDPTPMRATMRTLSGTSEFRVKKEWLDIPSRPAGSPEQMRSALGELFIVEEPGWGIWPLVMNAHNLGAMAALPRLDDEDIKDGFRSLLRVAAHSMLSDDPSHAPYGWSHALTIPLGFYETLPTHSKHREAYDAATILAAGFRLGHGAGPLESEIRLPNGPPPLPQDLINAASVRHDAHLIKYVQACLIAATVDPEYEALYRHSANYLVEWWQANPGKDDPVQIST